MDNLFSILAVDDESHVLDSLKDYFDNEYRVVAFSDPREALKDCERNQYDILLADHRMPHISGFELLLEARKLTAYTCGIMLTAYADKELLIQVINQNLLQFILEKPFSMEDLSSVFLEASSYVREIREYRNALGREETIIGLNGDLSGISRIIRMAAPTTENILITGETGTGKEVIARRIHRESSRASGPFVKINCAALPEHLLESELFGYVKGAFTGALEGKAGKIETSHSGTLFLDEIAEMKPELQTKLLTVLQDKTIERLGSNTVKPVDFRLITATNQDIEKLVAARMFREDLYYRINTVHIHLPPLRERKHDLLKISQHLLRQFSFEFDRPGLRLSEEAERLIYSYPWPGNIRELENLLKRAIILLPPAVHCLGKECFPFLGQPEPAYPGSRDQLVSHLTDLVEKRQFSLDDLQEQVLKELFRRYNGDIPGIVKSTGIPRDRLYRRRDRLSPRD